MDTERVLDDQTVLVEDGRITALGPVRQVQVPAGAWRIDGRGKYLIPGLADMHEHSLVNAIGTYEERLRQLLSYVASGVTTLRSFSEIGQVVGGEDELLRLSKTDTLLGPRIHMAPSFMEKFKVRPNRPSPRLDSIATYVAEYKAAGYDFILIPSKYMRTESYDSAAVRDSMLVAAQRLSLPVGEHAHIGMMDEDTTGIQRLLAFGASGGAVEHLYAFSRILGLRTTADATPQNVSEIPSLAAAIQRAGVWITPTLDCTESTYYWSSTEVVRVRRQLVKAMADAGARLLLAADDGGSVHSELTTLVKAGLSPYQALRTGTRNVAEYFRLLDSAGTIAVGKRADLVLLNGNPLLDIRYTREPAGVMIRGRWLDRSELDARLTVPMPRVRSWLEMEVERSRLSMKQRADVKPHLETFNHLTDSLDAVRMSSEQGMPRDAKHLLGLIAGELGAIRAMLTPEQQATFDPMARMWMRAQAQRGEAMAVPGVAATP